MHITDLLMKYRTPLFENADTGGGGAPAPAAEPAAAPADPAPAAPAADDAAKTALSGDATPADPNAAKPEGDDADAAPADDGAVPEFKLTAPEGMEQFQGEFDKYSSDGAEWIAANPNATAAEALAWAAERQAGIAKEGADGYKSHIEAENAQIEQWNTELKSDKVLGGDNYETNVAQAQAAINAFGDDALKKMVNDTSLGSNPGFVRMAFEAGKAVIDSDVVMPNAQGGATSALSSRYGNTK